jgi:Fe-S cluster assembly iron-binding protein IscA
MVKLTKAAAEEISRVLLEHPETVGVRLYVRGYG